jgi:DNA-binding FrmR family transcriptional regulator
MKLENTHTQQDILKCLRRIEGQVRGVQTMIADQRECHEIFQQLTAIQSAVRSVSLQLLESSASTCFQDLAQNDDPQARQLLLEDILALVRKNA